MLFLRLSNKIIGKYVKTFYVEDPLEYGRIFIDVLKLFKDKNNYALRLDFTLSNNRKFSLWMTKDYRAVLISQTTLDIYGIFDLNTISSYMPLIIDVFALTRNDYLASTAVLSYMQKLCKVNVFSLTPYEIENYKKRILRSLSETEKLGRIKEYSISSELTRKLQDVVMLSKIILYRNNLCDTSFQLPIEKWESIRDIINKVIRNVEASIRNYRKNKIVVYVHMKLKKYVVRMLINVHERYYGVTISVENIPIDLRDVFEEPIGKYLEGEHAELTIRLKCLPSELLSSLQ